MPDYLFDACALLTLFNDEEGAEIVSELLDRAERGEITLSINAANLIEVYYDRIRAAGTDRADAIIREVYKTFPLSIIETLDFAIIREAARFKAHGKMSFADAILVATAYCTGATVVTCDHFELKPVEQQGNISFLWIRPQY
jgi:predicted nucleic acid-binding protein